MQCLTISILNPLMSQDPLRARIPTTLGAILSTSFSSVAICSSSRFEATCSLMKLRPLLFIIRSSLFYFLASFNWLNLCSLLRMDPLELLISERDLVYNKYRIIMIILQHDHLTWSYFSYLAYSLKWDGICAGSSCII